MTEQERYQNCPYCAEKIKHGALKCKYCHSMIEASASSSIEENAPSDDSGQFLLSENVDENVFHDNNIKNTGSGEPQGRLSEEIQNIYEPAASFSRDAKQPTTTDSITPAARERIAAMESYKDTFAWLFSMSYVFCALFVGIGFYKLFAYNNPEGSYGGNLVNAYVGGDAYNFIINANLATTYFAIAILCALIGLTFVLCFLFYTHEIKNELNL
jgi:hypothetical protein